MPNPLEITYRNPNDLIKYANNAKVHSGDQIDSLASSIKHFGFNNPILVDGENGIIAGHGRRDAAVKLGLESVPTIDLSHLSEADKRAYILADNRLGEIGVSWDDELLNIELEALKGLDFDLELTGFDLELGGEDVDFDDVSIDEGIDYQEGLEIAITCENESQQESLFNELSSRGLNCRVLSI